MVRIVDPDTGTEKPAGRDRRDLGARRKRRDGLLAKPATDRSARSARKLVNPSPGTPEGPWLRTGDLGVMSEGELFIIGRIKDLLIVDGRNHYPDDIEATIQEITGGRVAAISIPDDRTRAAGGDRGSSRSEVTPRRRPWTGFAPSNAKSPRRFRSRTVCAWPIWCWCRRDRFRSPRAARFAVRPAWSGTGRTNSAAWTSRYDGGFRRGLLFDTGWSTTW